METKQTGRESWPKQGNESLVNPVLCRTSPSQSTKVQWLLPRTLGILMRLCSLLFYMDRIAAITCSCKFARAPVNLHLTTSTEYDPSSSWGCYPGPGSSSYNWTIATHSIQPLALIPFRTPFSYQTEFQPPQIPTSLTLVFPLLAPGGCPHQILNSKAGIGN